MQYERIEHYSFHPIEEYDEYLKFKEDLKESNIPFKEYQSTMSYTLELRTFGTFDMRRKNNGH